MEIERNAVHPFLMNGDRVRWENNFGVWKVYDNYVDQDGDIKIVREGELLHTWKYAPAADLTRDEFVSATTVDTLKEEVWAAFIRHYDPTSGTAKQLAADFAQLGIAPKKKKWRAVAEVEGVAPPTTIFTVFGMPVEWVEVTDGDD